jgi:hypothetical protein
MTYRCARQEARQGRSRMRGMAQREERWDNGFALKKPREGRHKVSSQGYAAPDRARLDGFRLYPRLFAVGQTMSALTGLA